MIILGIDPGSLRMGYGVVQVEGRTYRALDYGVWNLASISEHGDRLKAIYAYVAALIEQHVPQVCAVEMPVYGRNPQSMLKLGRAQAAAMLAALHADLPVAQYTPKTVKQSVTGNGNAAKEQVRYMVERLLVYSDQAAALRHDASDALAIALCHCHRSAPKHYADWSAFLRANPGRV